MQLAYSTAGDLEKRECDKSRANPVGDGIGERHQEQRDESWNRFLVACLGNVLNNRHHHQPHQDQTRCGCLGWDDGGHRTEQNGAEKK
jgi:hypothetical protein